MFSDGAGLVMMNSARTGPVMGSSSPTEWATGADIVTRSTPVGATRSACQPTQTSVKPWFSRNPSPWGVAVVAPTL